MLFKQPSFASVFSSSNLTCLGFPLLDNSVQFSSVAQSCPTLCDPMNLSTPGFPVHHHLPEFRLMSIESVMPSSHLILYRPLILLPPIPPSIKVFSNESAFCMRWPKDWSFSFSISKWFWNHFKKVNQSGGMVEEAQEGGYIHIHIYIYAQLWLIYVDVRDHHNIIKQLSSN